MTGAVDTLDDRAFRLTSLRRELFFHRERGKQVETDPDVTADDRAKQVAYHDKIIKRLRQQLVDLEGY